LPARTAETLKHSVRTAKNLNPRPPKYKTGAVTAQKQLPILGHLGRIREEILVFEVCEVMSNIKIKICQTVKQYDTK
jgi:hypothetical protein